MVAVLVKDTEHVSGGALQSQIHLVANIGK